MENSGIIIHLAGVPAVGKTTIAHALAKLFKEYSIPVEILDGDEVRKTFFPELGLDQKAREENVRRTFTFASRLAKHGVYTIVSLIAPYEESRRLARKEIEDFGIPFFMVYLQAPKEVLMARDPKGLYAKFARGEIKGLTGMDAPYEVPLAPDFSIDTSLSTPDDCANLIKEAVQFRIRKTPEEYAELLKESISRNR